MNLIMLSLINIFYFGISLVLFKSKYFIYLKLTNIFLTIYFTYIYQIIKL